MFLSKRKKTLSVEKYTILAYCTRTEISLDLVSKFEQLSHATEQVFRVKKHVILV